MEGKLPTYKKAQAGILDALAARGWKVRRDLKTPYATNPDGGLRLWFKPQAVWYSVDGNHTIGDAHSTWIGDIRMMTPEAFVVTIDRMFHGRYALENSIANDYDTFSAALDHAKKQGAKYIYGMDDQFYIFMPAGTAGYERRSLFRRNNNWHLGNDIMTWTTPPKGDAVEIAQLEAEWSRDPGYKADFEAGKGVAGERAVSTAAPAAQASVDQVLSTVTLQRPAVARTLDIQPYEPGTRITGAAMPATLPAHAKSREIETVCGPFMKIEIDKKRFDACQATADKLGKIYSSKKIFQIAAPQLQREPDEVFCVMALSTQLTFRCFSQVHQGAIDRVEVSMRTVARYAIAYGMFYNALGIIVLHNHPSGDPKPSDSDIKLTKIVDEMCRINDLKLLDHLIIGSGDQYYSFADDGKLK